MNYKRILNWTVSIIGFIASVTTIYLYFFSSSNLSKLEFNYNGYERLTNLTDIKEPELAGIYYFNNIKIRHLWKVTVTIINTSDKTIVGEGNQKNIINDNLTFYLPKSYKLLKVEKIYSDLPLTHFFKSRNFVLEFSQWRKNERIVLSFYVETPTPEIDRRLFLETEKRQLLDGDIVYNNSENKPKPYYFSEFLPSIFRKFFYIIAIAFLLVIIILISFYIISAPISYQKRRLWKKENIHKFKEFLNIKFKSNDSLKEKFQKNPNELPKPFWKEFDGEKYPKLTVELSTDTATELVIMMLIFFAINFSLIVITSDLSQSFYRNW
ncbi:hypothetical protein [Leptospira vanthielii]|uniref:Uncharacterized protein n=1 Tax=Leptospira vanthielii serovar Holland str. Waz Holland = ATCC 700522 TaxID=1218591 RepID=N1WCG4_9LEPT|nr:hypothetical protein [Leptospira vanthielii]EMY71105.1 hypothetical protein LEP1GSC199_0635 [Leptospira vanthielii serovar Holland str. Waz Holland = ATCC 700522]